jgi:hypothetical protein
MAVYFLEEVAASLSEAASAVSAADNTADDIPDEIPDSIRPTNTDSRNTGLRRSKPFPLANSFANRNTPNRSSSRGTSSTPPPLPRQTPSPERLAPDLRYIPV